LLTADELRKIKIQIIPNSLRIFFFVLGLISAAASYHFFTQDFHCYGILSALLAILMLLFGVFGVRRTSSKILDSMDAIDAAEILVHAGKGISSAVESLFDGL
jgi:sulfite exporter TauE/SafE